MPLNLKIQYTLSRIRQFYQYYNGNVYVSFSGGKDSTVLLALARKMYPNINAVFIDTGLEFPEIRNFIKSIDNVTWLKPKIPFNKVIEKYGFPVISKEVSQQIFEIRNTKSFDLKNKRLYGDCNGNGKLSNKWKYLIDSPFKISSKCCDVMKKAPIKIYEEKTGRKPIIGTMAVESNLRKMNYLKNGCNTFEINRPKSLPISF